MEKQRDGTLTTDRQETTFAYSPLKSKQEKVIRDITRANIKPINANLKRSIYKLTVHSQQD